MKKENNIVISQPLQSRDLNRQFKSYVRSCVYCSEFFKCPSKFGTVCPKCFEINQANNRAKVRKHMEFVKIRNKFIKLVDDVRYRLLNTQKKLGYKMNIPAQEKKIIFLAYTDFATSLTRDIQNICPINMAPRKNKVPEILKIDMIAEFHRNRRRFYNLIIDVENYLINKQKFITNMVRNSGEVKQIRSKAIKEMAQNIIKGLDNLNSIDAQSAVLRKRRLKEIGERRLYEKSKK